MSLEPTAFAATIGLRAPDTYLNTASTAPLCRLVEESVGSFFADGRGADAPWDRWMAEVADLREVAGSLLGVAASRVALISSVSAALAAVLNGLDGRSGRTRLLGSDLDFGGLGQLLHAQQTRGFRVNYLRLGRRTGREATQRLVDAITSDTALVTVPLVSSASPARVDVELIVRRSSEVGALTFVDASQAAGVLQVNARELGADFVAASTNKFLLGLPGLAIMAVSGKAWKAMAPTTSGWMADRLLPAADGSRLDLDVSARRFEGGTPPFANVYAARATVTALSATGIGPIAKHVGGLAQQIAENLPVLDPGAHLGPLVFIPTSAFGGPIEVRRRLRLGRIEATVDERQLRVALHGFTSSGAVDTLVEVLSTEGGR